jgi:hypothetical protein
LKLAPEILVIQGGRVRAGYGIGHDFDDAADDALEKPCLEDCRMQ